MIPIEWLQGLDQQRDGYRRLLDDAGGLAAAAHQLARVRCQTWETATAVPTRMEVRAAARKIAMRVGLGTVPTGPLLARECEAQGLLVL